MPGGDRPRSVDGSTARLLPTPGESLTSNPSTVEDVPASTVDGVLSPPSSVDSTPTADGTTPVQERTRAQGLAESILDSQSGAEGPDGRSPDPRRTADESGTGGSSTTPSDSTDPRRTSSDPTASREAAPIARGGSPPHYFTERPHQTYYHDAIVYIEGEDVSPFLTGTIQVTYGAGTDYNKCDFTLDNAGHRFVLTPENLQGSFRRASPTGNENPFDYDESIKARLYESKSDPDHNPVDPLSGGRRFPLHLWSTVFHKHDAVRVFIHNPASELDEWIPAFTGFIVSKPVNENYIDGLNTLQVSCADIRYLMSRMRVNTNTMFAVLPGSSATDGADPTNQDSITRAEVFRVFDAQGNREFERGFFSDLIVGATSLDNPWVALNLPELIASLTFLPGQSTSLFEAGASRRLHTLSGNTRAAEDAAAAELQPLLRRVQVNGEGSLSDSELSRYRRLLVESGVGVSSSGVTAGTAPGGDDVDEAEDPSAPTPPPGASTGSTTADTTSREQRAVGTTRGSGAIGRMRPGVFPFFGTLYKDPPRPYAAESYFPSASASRSRAVSDRQIQHRLLNWYNLCLFGTPVRHNFVPSTQGKPEDAPPDHSRGNRRYWSEEEVRQAGRSTRREGAWHPEAQAVHFLSPGNNTPTDSLFDIGTTAGTQVAQNLNWTTRLQLICDACDTVDYRFWVSGCGDLIFEFAQYDFSPEDYGSWSEVLNLDHHLLNDSFDEEAGDVVTAVLANGSFTGLSGEIPEGNITPLNPARTVGIWSPNLSSRLGLHVKVLSFPQITDVHRLEQLATLDFQKLLAAADHYSIGVVFRPWLTLNRPIFNKYRERLALIDGLSWTLPVTAGQLAGQQPPSMNVTLNYTRSYDELGIPRYITGGPDNPMYFGIPADARVSLTSTLQQRVEDFQSSISSLRTSHTLTTEQFSALRDSYRAIVPNGQATYNVIDAAYLGSPDRVTGEEDPVVTELRGLEAELDELSVHAGALTEAQRSSRLTAIHDRIEEIQTTLRDRGVASAAEHTVSGVRPRVGVSGVRSTLTESEDVVVPPPPPAPEEPLCYPGDPRFYSAPTGPSTRVIPRWAAWVRSLPDRQRRSISDSYSRGTIPDEQIDRGVGTWQFPDEFPRIVTSGFGIRPSGFHQGVDIPMDLGEPCYAVSDGIVFNISQSVSRNGQPGQGMALGLIHSGGFVTFYRHQNNLADGIELGATVKRNQIVSYTGFSGTERRETQTHLHFETGAIYGSEVFNRYVGAGKRFRVTTPAEREVGHRAVIGGPDSAERARTQASIRVILGFGSSTSEVLQQWDPELVSRFNLDFFRRRDGSLGLGARLVLLYNPIPNSDPFSNAETTGQQTPVTDVTTLQEYYDNFGLKGIPALRMAAEPTRFAPEPVPEVPAGATDRQRRRIEQQRTSAMQHNASLQQRLAAYTTSRNQQVSLFANEVPPNTCPPERYEGNVPRQAGDPLPTRERLTQETAESARRRSS